MAAVSRAGNTVYVTAAGDVYAVTGVVYIVGVILTPATHGTGTPSITITDQQQSPAKKLSLATVNTTTFFLPLDTTPIACTGGFSISALSGAVATIIVSG